MKTNLFAVVAFAIVLTGCVRAGGERTPLPRPTKTPPPPVVISVPKVLFEGWAQAQSEMSFSVKFLDNATGEIIENEEKREFTYEYEEIPNDGAYTFNIPADHFCDGAENVNDLKVVSYSIDITNKENHSAEPESAILISFEGSCHNRAPLHCAIFGMGELEVFLETKKGGCDDFFVF